GDGPGAVEEVHRDAALDDVVGRAAVRDAAGVLEARAKSVAEVADDELAVDRRAGGAAAEVEVDVPRPLLVGAGDGAVEAEDGAERIDVLGEVTATGLDDAAAHVDEVTAERVVDVVRGGDDRRKLRVRQRRGEDRLRREELRRLAVRVRRLEVAADGLAEVV